MQAVAPETEPVAASLCEASIQNRRKRLARVARRAKATGVENLHRDRCFDRGMRFVSLEREILEVEIVNIFHGQI